MPVIKQVEQDGVVKRNLLIKVVDALGCSKREALMLMASLRQLEKDHPEYKIQEIPFPAMLDMIKQIYTKQQESKALDQSLSGNTQDTNNLDQMLNQG